MSYSYVHAATYVSVIDYYVVVIGTLPTFEEEKCEFSFVECKVDIHTLVNHYKIRNIIRQPYIYTSHTNYKQFVNTLC